MRITDDCGLFAPNVVSPVDIESRRVLNLLCPALIGGAFFVGIGLNVRSGYPDTLQGPGPPPGKAPPALGLHRSARLWTPTSATRHQRSTRPDTRPALTSHTVDARKIPKTRSQIGRHPHSFPIKRVYFFAIKTSVPSFKSSLSRFFALP